MTTACAKWDYDTTEPNELAFKTGDVLTVRQKHNSDWWEGELNGRAGFFPANRVEEIEPPKPALATKPTGFAVPQPQQQQPQQQPQQPQQSSSLLAEPQTSSVRKSVARLSLDLAPIIASQATPPSPTSPSKRPLSSYGAPATATGRLSVPTDGQPESTIARSLNTALLARISAPSGVTGDQSPSTPGSAIDTPPDYDSGGLDEDGELTNLEPPAQADIRKEGMLSRKNDGSTKKALRSWRQVWVELSTNGGSILYFYKDAPNKKKSLDKRDPPMSGVEVRGCMVEIPKVSGGDKKKYSFQVSTARGQVYLFQAQNDSDCLAWMEAITEEAAASAAKRPLLLRQESRLTVKKSSNKDDEPPKEKKSGLFGSKSRADNSKSSTVKGSKGATDNNTNDENMTEEQRRQNVKSKLFSFFKQRPNVDTLKERGIIRDDILLFGGSLEATCKRDNCTVPYVVEQCTKRVEERGLDAVGIYRLSGNASTIQKLRFLYNEDVSLVNLADEQWSDINVVTGTLKLYFRELQTPLMTHELYQPFVDAARINDGEARLRAITALVKRLPPAHYSTLEYIVRHLQRVQQHAEVNKMEWQNLAIVFGPTLLRPLVDSVDTMMNMGHQNTAIEVIIANADIIFGRK